MPEDFEDTLEIGAIVSKRYRVLQKLGAGGCGSVYKVEDTEDKSAMYALKVEFNGADAIPVLKMEVQVLTQMKDKKHVARCVASGKKQRYSYMVMTLLGDSLENVVKKHGPFLNVSTTARVGICLLFGIKQLHDIGYIHRDLKPANVALGRKGTADERFLMVLDFGLARQYIADEQDGKKMRRPRDRANFRGTKRYCSIAMHERQEQGRVDDLWALVYILAELRCRLAWHDVYEKEDIGRMKKQITDEELMAKSPMQMLQFINILRGTQFYHRPDYVALYKVLEDIMQMGAFKWSDPYHWERDETKNPTGESVEKTKKLAVFPAPSLKITKNKAKPPQLAATPPSTTITPTSGTSNVNEIPYFTVADFKSNPIGL